MEFLDDLPKRHSTHDTAEAAETAFEAAIGTCKLFIVQQKDRRDYGTDVQIEARDGDAMTNLRVHVQLKGTETAANADGSISVEVARANLNYLLAQRDSIYVCYHVPSQRLLVSRLVNSVRLFGSLDRLKDGFGGLGPDERLGRMLVVGLDVTP